MDKTNGQSLLNAEQEREAGQGENKRESPTEALSQRRKERGHRRGPRRRRKAGAAQSAGKEHPPAARTKKRPRPPAPVVTAMTIFRRDTSPHRDSHTARRVSQSDWSSRRNPSRARWRWECGAFELESQRPQWFILHLAFTPFSPARDAPYGPFSSGLALPAPTRPLRRHLDTIARDAQIEK
ncbi:hypothetical protein XA68_10511 [Ophiocordyceps unilateralis]|uniref:Uncharacterized protein n=1 Tax=Ophiocordyceps unilateralis TaxID=268505 RepID=A0A2A9PIG5_OPHUN|nr:hypothetical protein XA68_10511 [Ophiocordyceps unilateralis]